MNDQETRRLTVLLPVREVEQLRKLLLPNESMNDLLRRIVHERITMQEAA